MEAVLCFESYAFRLLQIKMLHDTIYYEVFRILFIIVKFSYQGY